MDQLPPQSGRQVLIERGCTEGKCVSWLSYLRESAVRKKIARRASPTCNRGTKQQCEHQGMFHGIQQHSAPPHNR